jgi:CNT family concentrative nucleoside transporter
MTFIQPVLGLGLLLLIAWCFSEKRNEFPLRWSLGAIVLQIILAIVFLRIETLRQFLAGAGSLVQAVERASRAGSSYMFGYLGGGDIPFDLKDGASTFIIAFEILPIILVMAAISALLWHWDILPKAIRGLSWALQRTMGVSGTVGLGTGANFFLGVVESPLMLRAYIAQMNRTELFMIMVAGLSTVSGAVLVLYASVIEGVVSDATGHILTASLISLPAALLFAKIMVPGECETEAFSFDASIRYDNVLDALVNGVEDGLKVFLNVMAMLIVIFALVYLANEILDVLPTVYGEPLTVNRIFGWVFAPLVFAFGVPLEEAHIAGQLMGAKAILNEFIAYQQLANLPTDALSVRSSIIMTYALCGFANLASIGLQIATFGALAPSKRSEIASLGWRAWLAGNLATGSTAAIAALVLPS